MLQAVQMKKLPQSFYDRTDVVQIARELLGKIVVTDINDRYTSGRIVETEAYVANIDKASHAFGGRRTAKNEHMYSPPGTAYIYICYGVHHMLNVVTNKEGIPDAVLIRAVEPLEGIDIMLERTGRKKADHAVTRGPGNAGKALGIFRHMSGIYLTDSQIYLADDGFEVKPEDIAVSKRIGVDSAGADAQLPYRFYIRDNPYVSGARPRQRQKNK